MADVIDGFWIGDVIDMLHAYDVGALDSGVSDPSLRAKLVAQIEAQGIERVVAIGRSLYDKPIYTIEDRDEIEAWLRGLA